MAWDEWERIKAAVAEVAKARAEASAGASAADASAAKARAADAGAAGARAEATSGPVDCGEPLQHSAGPWGRVAGAVGRLRTDTEMVERELLRTHEGLTDPGHPGMAELASAAAVRDLLASWEARLSAVREECACLVPALSVVAGELPDSDKAIGLEKRPVPAPRGAAHGGGVL